ncbi:porin [Zavarzinia sp.]|uniref:porin n=1 Tax=Zavarzinia sp. TaxID=2027920 RepID=UPI003568F5C0
MKKLLLGTTALATAALLSAGASAAEGPKVTVSGFYTGVLMAGDDGIPSDRNVSLDTWNTEVHFNAEGTAANGLTYGAHIELEGTSTNDQIDESFMYLKGGFGQLIIGNDDPVGEKMGYISPAPDAYGILSVNSPNYNFSGATVTTVNEFGGDASKVIYISPQLSGFQFGLSYSPDSCEDNNAAAGSPCNNGGFEADNNAGAGNGQQFAAALAFSKEFSGVNLGLSATYSWNESEGAGLKDVTLYGFGANVGAPVGAGTVTLGGSYLATKNLGGFKDVDADAFDAGLQYAQGPWTVGVQSAWYSDDGTNDDIYAVSFGGGYEVATGLGVSAGMIHYDRQRNVGSDANVFLVGTKLSF